MSALVPSAPLAGDAAAPLDAAVLAGARLGRPLAPRPAPGLTVLALPAERMPLAGYLLRHGPALAVVEDPLDAIVVGPSLAGGFGAPLFDPAAAAERRELLVARAAQAVANAGFAEPAVEPLSPGSLPARLRRLRGEADVACVVVGGGGARRVRRLARAAGAPVLVLPAGASAAGGPVVLCGHDADAVAAPAARALATEDAVVVATFGPVRRSELMGASSGAAAVGAGRRDPAADLRRRAWTVAGSRADRGMDLCREHGLRARPAVCDVGTTVLDVAARREGILAVADAGDRRVPHLLLDALRARRPVLLVPAGRG